MEPTTARIVVLTLSQAVEVRRLERDLSFVLLWSGQTLSSLGSSVSALAIPTAAIFLFHAGPLQVSFLGALEVLPFAGLGLLLGPYADRVRKRPIMIACDVGRFVLLGSIPVAGVAHALTLGQLYAVAFGTGCFNVFFQVAYQAYLPGLVTRSRLMAANSRLYVTQTAADTLGPAIGGLLIQLVGAALAIAVDAASYVASAIAFLLIPRPEPRTAGALRGSFRVDLAEGLRFVLGHPILRRIAAGNATFTIGWRAIEAILLLYCYRVLHLSPAQAGLLFGVSGLATVVGALLREPATRLIGFGRLLVITSLLCALPCFVIAGAGLGLGPPAMVVAFVVQGIAAGMFDVAQLTFRQLLTPDRLQARMNATMRALFWGPRPLGFLLGGFAGSLFGLIPTIVLGGIICAVATVFWVTPRIVSLRAAPEPVET
jgi:MFS family permease